MNKENNIEDLVDSNGQPLSNRAKKKILWKKNNRFKQKQKANLYKCPNRLLMFCNNKTEGLQGQKMHLTKILAYYCYIRKRINSGHIFNYSKIPENFKEVKNFMSNTSFKKYNLLLVMNNFAEFTPDNKGIKIFSLEKATKIICCDDNNKIKIEKEPCFNIDFDDKINKLKDFHKILLEQLYDDTLERVFKADELKRVPTNKRSCVKRILRDELTEKYFNYFTTTINMSNKQIGKIFSMSRNYAYKFRKYIEEQWKNKSVEIKFLNYQVNINQFDDLVKQYPNFKYYGCEPTYYLNKYTPVKNLGQRLVVVRKEL